MRERSLTGRFRIEVARGRVVDVVALDESATAMLDAGQRKLVPSLHDLEEEVLAARDAGADVIDIEYGKDPDVPKRIQIDYNEAAIDDEACYDITRYREL